MVCQCSWSVELVSGNLIFKPSLCHGSLQDNHGSDICSDPNLLQRVVVSLGDYWRER